MVGIGNKIAFLAFHGVMDIDIAGPDTWDPILKRTSPAALQSYLDILTQNAYRFISLPVAIDMLSNRLPMESNCVCLTFDDDYRNLVTRALPILREYSAPAAFFVVTGPVESQSLYWFDRADYAIQHLLVSSLEINCGLDNFVIRAETRDEMADSFTRLRQLYRKHRLQDVVEVVEKIEEAASTSLEELGMQDEWSAILTWQDLVQLDPEEITVGSHTVNHARLDSLDDTAALEQLVDSRATIGQKLKVDCDHFCYPSGLFTDSTLELLRQANYKSAVTTIAGVNAVGADLYTLKRINVSPDMSDKDLLRTITNETRLL